VVAQMLGVAVLALLDPVDECQAAGFLVAGDRPGDYRFSHALVRSAVVAQLSAADQRRRHVAAAGAIDRLYQGKLRPHLAELAQHRVAGSLPGDRLDAARACQAAGEAAAEDLAFEEAARLYRQALSVGAGEISEGALGPLELALAGALFRSGDIPGWHDTLAELAQRAERAATMSCSPGLLWRWTPSAPPDGTARSDATASGHWPDLSWTARSGPGSWPGTPRSWPGTPRSSCTGENTDARTRLAGWRWTPPS
jgi:hypothetical protein